MDIRRTENSDLDRLTEIYRYAREFMADHGNPDQWGPTNWPTRERIQQDIDEGVGFVVEHDGRIVGHFGFIWGPDPTYFKIADGEWTDDSRYAVIHRLAGDGSVRGIGSCVLDWAYEKSGGHLRVDTMPENYVMRNLLEKKDFVRCGIIYVERDDFPRIAYEKSDIASKKPHTIYENMI